LEFNVPFQHKYGYIRDDNGNKDGLLHGLICWAPGLPGEFSGRWGHTRWTTNTLTIKPHGSYCTLLAVKTAN